MDGTIDKVTLTPLKHISGEAGDIFHIMRSDAEQYSGFGEVYISTVKPGHIKGWKRHRKMSLNLVVPIGQILFVLYDDRPESPTNGKIQEVTLSPDNYLRLSIPPGIWVAFRCMADRESFLINFANITHDPTEADAAPLDSKFINYEWR